MTPTRITCDRVAIIPRADGRVDVELSNAGPVAAEGPDADLDRILSAVVLHFRVPRVDIIHHRRPEPVVTARLAFYLLARQLTRRSLSSIGRYIDRDHGAVLHGIRAAEARMDTQPSFRASVYTLTKQLA